MDSGTTNQNGAMEVECQPLNAADIETYKKEMREKQNILKGIIGGIAGAIVGAVLWAGITEMTQYQIGWMAVGVGFLVGYCVRILGKGVDKIFGVVGAILALVGCFGGNILTVVFSISSSQAMPITSVISQMKVEFLINIIEKTFSPIDLVFYALAVYEGFKYSIIEIEADENED